MCGIYGWQQRSPDTLSSAQRAILTLTLAEEMEKRGRDSHGAAIWTPGSDDPTIIKHLGKITETGSGLFTATAEACTALVHTRAATTGRVIEENSHPFDIGDILGVHNGQIYNHKDLAEKYERNFEVDSMHIFGHINENKDLTELDGYGAIVYAKRSEAFKVLYVGRSSTGSMEVARFFKTDPGKDTGDREPDLIVFASTYTALSTAARRLGMYMRSITVTPQHLYTIVNGQIFDPNTRFPLCQKWVKVGNDHRQYFIGCGSGQSTNTHGNSSVEPKDVKVPTGKSGLASAKDLVMVAPLPSKIVDDAHYYRVYRGGSNSAARICKQAGCYDELRSHIWGYCTDDMCKVGGKPITEHRTSLGGDVCTTGNLPICNCCGHYLIASLHKHLPTRSNPDQVGCIVCGELCSQKQRLSKAERKRQRRMARTQGTADVVTTTPDQSKVTVLYTTCSVCEIPLTERTERVTGLCGNHLDKFLDGTGDDLVNAIMWDCQSRKDTTQDTASDRIDTTACDDVADDMFICAGCGGSCSLTLATTEAIRTGKCLECREDTMFKPSRRGRNATSNA